MTDHDLRQSFFGLLRLGDSIEQGPVRDRLLPLMGRWETRFLMDALSAAIAGNRRWVADESEDRVANLSPERQEQLMKFHLPELDNELTKMRIEIERLIRDAYLLGVRDGSDLLRGLSAGTVSVATFNERTGRQ